jgi:hypothetical protein
LSTLSRPGNTSTVLASLRVFFGMPLLIVASLLSIRGIALAASTENYQTIPAGSIDSVLSAGRGLSNLPVKINAFYLRTRPVTTAEFLHLPKHTLNGKKPISPVFLRMRVTSARYLTPAPKPVRRILRSHKSAGLPPRHTANPKADGFRPGMNGNMSQRPTKRMPMRARTRNGGQKFCPGIPNPAVPARSKSVVRPIITASAICMA